MKIDLIRRVEELSVELADVRKAIATQKRVLALSERDAEKYTMLRNVLWRGLRYNADSKVYEVSPRVVDKLSGKERQVWDELAAGTPRV